jgi:hypothetical protein
MTDSRTYNPPSTNLVKRDDASIPVLQIPCNFISIGMTKSGKTHSFRYLFSKIYHQFAYGVCFSTTIDLNDDYDYLPKKCKFAKYDPRFIKAMMSKQYSYISKYKQAIAKNPDQQYDPPPHCFIIIDDCLGTIDFHHSIFNELFSKSRHLNISCFVLIQHMTGISPIMRINAMYTCITKIKANNIASLYELVSCFESVTDLRTFLSDNCVNYNVILFDDADPYKSTPYIIFKCPADNIKYLVQF